MHDLSCEMKSNPPKISIGLVVYNGVEHIRDALESIVKQSYRNVELIVVDGGSTDGTQGVLGEYAEHISMMISEPDKGIYDAMNKVCALATGDWLIFIGCDDVLLDTIGILAKLLNNPDSVYYGDVILSTTGEIYGGKFSKYRLAQMNICHQAMFYPRLVYKRYSYGMEYRWLADYAYNLKLFSDEVPFSYTGVVVTIFNEMGRSSAGDAEFAKKKISLIRALLGSRYALFEILRLRLEKLTKEEIPRAREWVAQARKRITWVGDQIVINMGKILKRLLPYSFWKYPQSIWRWFRNKY